MGKGGQTIGYNYFMDILFGLGRGPWNTLRTIKVGDKIAWEGPMCSDDVQAIRKPFLFGGEKKEGGIQGPFRVFWGGKDQILPGAGVANCSFFQLPGGTILWIFSMLAEPYGGPRTLPNVKTAIGGLMSEFRGTTMLWFSGLVTSMNPYPKEWAFRGQRYSAGWYDDNCWYPAKSGIFLDGGEIRAMNPAHILYQCFTDPQWGRGYDPANLDENSFIYAANTLCAEGFGLCLVWQRDDQNLDDFIAMVCQYIDGEWYTDPGTGKVVLQLHREDYDPDTLPLFTPSTGLIDITEDDAAAGDEVFTQIVGTGRDPITNEDFTVRVYNLAASVAQDAPNTQKKDYKGIPTKDLMARVLARDLRVPALGLKRYKIVLDRRGFKLRPGMPFKISDPRRGIGSVIVRAGQIDDKSFRDGRLNMTVVQDVFGLPSGSFVNPPISSWNPPSQQAVPATAQQLFETNYRDLARRVDSTVLDTLVATDSIVGAVALSPNPVMYEFELVTHVDGASDAMQTTGPFTGAAVLTADVAPLDTAFVVTSEQLFDDSNVGEALLIDDEQVSFEAYDAATHTVTVKRGCGDTIPQKHLAGARLWTVDDEFVTDARKYASGETVDAFVLTRTASDLLDPSETTQMSVAVSGRQARPYPPAGVTVDGQSVFSITGEHAEPFLEWTHRDRLLQMDQLVGYDEASVGPEPGTTYTVRVYLPSDPDTAVRTESGISGTSWTYDAAMQGTDGSPTAVWIELESERDGLASHQRYRFYVQIIAGYGLGYGMNYGGA